MSVLKVISNVQYGTSGSGDVRPTSNGSTHVFSYNLSDPALWHESSFGSGSRVMHFRIYVVWRSSGSNFTDAAYYIDCTPFFPDGSILHLASVSGVPKQFIYGEEGTKIQSSIMSVSANALRCTITMAASGAAGSLAARGVLMYANQSSL